MKNIKIVILFLLFVVITASSQSKYSNYYYQRASLFELLPITSNDIVFVGNSITNGAEWSELFQNSDIKNRGISGDTAQGVLDRLSAIINGHPKKIFLMIGVNDLIKGVTPDAVAIIMQKIIQEIKFVSPKTEIYIQSVLPSNRNLSIEVLAQGGIKGLNDLIMKIAEEQNVVYIDLFSHFRCEYSDSINPHYSNDGLHLIGKGYMLWKQIVMPHVN